MKNFSELGIKTTTKGFEGDKIKIERVLNREITVHDYKIQDSKFENKGKCLHLQIKIGENKHVVFTGSGVLMDMIQKVPPNEFPFRATIVKENERLEFR